MSGDFFRVLQVEPQLGHGFRPEEDIDPNISISRIALLLTTIAASMIPARRAARIDPQQALRQD